MTKADWKHVQERLPIWRERYLDRRTRELARILTDGDGTPTERFWAARDAFDAEDRILRDCLDGYTKSRMPERLALMHRHGVIDDADLDGFSDETRACVQRWLQPWGDEG